MSKLSDVLLRLIYFIEENNPHFTEVADTCTCVRCEDLRDLKEKIEELNKESENAQSNRG